MQRMPAIQQALSKVPGRRRLKEGTMSRPDFPRPYTPLTAGMISRIREDQAHYDRDPEAAEREQTARREREALEQEERHFYDQLDERS